MPRQEAPVSRPVVLTIAGSDSGGGAGIQADLKTIEACGGFGTSAITSVTAQHTTGVESTHGLPVEEIDAQCSAVLSDFDVTAIKTGMLGTSEVIDLVTNLVRERDTPAVVDPVMVAASGDRLLEPDAEDAYEDLVAAATLVTPNADEATVLTGIEPEDAEDMIAVGDELVEMGAEAALVKGGHVPGDEVVDVLVTDDAVEQFRHERVATDATHGSGCTLSSAIATHLGHGVALEEAVERGVDLLARAVRYNIDVGEGPGAVHHMVETRTEGAATATVDAVEGIVERLVERDISQLVPETGTDVVGATPYAERPAEVAAVEGRIARTMSGVRPNRGVRMGASSRVAETLLAAREHDSDLRFALDCRLDDDIETALGALDGPVDTVEDEVEAVADGVETALDDSVGTPVAIVDDDPTGGVSSVTLLAADPDVLVGRTFTVLEQVDG